MIPANHAKTPENSRLDFFEDSMSPLAIDELKLYQHDWSRPSDLAMLTEAIEVLVTSYVASIAPTFFSNDVCQSLADTVVHWSDLENHKERHVPSVSILPPIISNPTHAALGCWQTFRYLSNLQLLQSTNSEERPEQTLFPASIAKYIALKGPSHSRYEPESIVAHKKKLIAEVFPFVHSHHTRSSRTTIDTRLSHGVVESSGYLSSCLHSSIRVLECSGRSTFV